MPDRLIRVSEVMRATIWSSWLSVRVSGDEGGTTIGTPAAGVVLPAGIFCENTGVPSVPGGLLAGMTLMTNVTSSVVTLGLTIEPVIVVVPFAGTVTVIGRPPKAKSVDAVKT